MIRNTLLALAAGGAIGFGALLASSGPAEAGTSVHIGIGVPGGYGGPGHGYYRPPYHRPGHGQRPDRYECKLPEKYLCGGRDRRFYGGYWGTAFYFGPAYHPRFYYHVRAPYHCHRWRDRYGHRRERCHRHW